MPLPVPDDSFGPFAEETTRYLQAAMVDENGTAIPGSALTSVEMTLFDEATGEILNSRDHIDILDSVDEDGLLVLELTPDDMAVLNDGLALEVHRLLIEWCWQTVRQGKRMIRLAVNNDVQALAPLGLRTSPVD